MTWRNVPVPVATQTTDMKTREDLRRIQAALSAFNSQLSTFAPAASGGSGTISDVTSSDGSIVITDPTGPVVDLAVNTSAIPGLEDIRSLIVSRPETPHADDDEFESTTLDSAWGFYNVGAGSGATTVWSASPPTDTALDPTSSSLSRYQLHTNRRRSWLKIQVADSPTTKGMLKPITPTTNMCLTTHISVPYQFGGSSTGSGMRVAFVIANDSGGLPNFANSLQIVVDKTNVNAAFIYCQGYTAGVHTYIPSAFGALTQPTPREDIPYFGFRKQGTDYLLYAGGEGYCVKFASTLTGFSHASLTPAWVGYIFDATTGANNAPVYGVNWLRRRDDLLALPW